jgi:RhtB (resistance to homoserine/threonine) family protein
MLAFIIMAAVLTITPGADMALVTRHALTGGRRAAVLTTLGICAGCLVHATASAFGLSVILARSATAFATVKWIGAAYLFYLGIQALRESASRVDAEAPAALEGPRPRGTPLVQGFLTNLLNPKVALFYLMVLPQFVTPGPTLLLQSLLLAGIHVLMGLVWLVAYASFIDRFSAFFAAPRVRPRLQAATGTVLMAFGVRLAFAER